MVFKRGEWSASLYACNFFYELKKWGDISYAIPIDAHAV